VKTIYFSFTLFLSSFSLFSQPYQPVAVENAHWFMNAAYPEPAPPAHHVFVVRGDTVVNTLAYKKLYYQELANQGQLSPPYLLADERLWGLIRDDEQARQVFVVAFEPYEFGYDCPLGEEHLLFDFSIQPGDSTGQCLWYEDYPWILDSVGTTWSYGADRRTLYSDRYEAPVSIIYEGIGSPDGLLGTLTYLPTIDMDYYWLHEYCVGTDADCGIISSAYALPEAGSGLSAFPNPARETVYLKTDIPLTPEAQIWVCDLFGRPVYQGLFPAAEKSISVGGWAPGLYLLQVEDGGRRYAVKFVKAQH
jgi:hypothetical protein